MSLIFGPGIALMHRLTNEQKFPALTALFWLPVAILLYHTCPQLTPGVIGLVLLTALLPAYLSASFYIQADQAWRLLLGVIRHISAGDLTATSNTRMVGYFRYPRRTVDRLFATRVVHAGPPPSTAPFSPSGLDSVR